MENYEQKRVKLTNNQLNKLKSAAENKTGSTSRITKKNFQAEEFPHDNKTKSKNKRCFS